VRVQPRRCDRLSKAYLPPCAARASRASSFPQTLQGKEAHRVVADNPVFRALDAMFWSTSPFSQDYFRVADHPAIITDEKWV